MKGGVRPIRASRLPRPAEFPHGKKGKARLGRAGPNKKNLLRNYNMNSAAESKFREVFEFYAGAFAASSPIKVGEWIRERDKLGRLWFYFIALDWKVGVFGLAIDDHYSGYYEKWRSPDHILPAGAPEDCVCNAAWKNDFEGHIEEYGPEIAMEISKYVVNEWILSDLYEEGYRKLQRWSHEEKFPPHMRNGAWADDLYEYHPSSIPNEKVELYAGLQVIPLNMVELEPVRWLWVDVVPFGKVTLLAGHPGLGKSFFSLYLAAMASIGGLLPDGIRCPLGDTLIFNCEDGAGDTIAPRLKKMGADLSKIHFADRVLYKSGAALSERAFTLDDIDLLEEELNENEDIVAVIIDPILGFFPSGKIDSHKVQDVRSLLGPLVALAQKHKVAIIIISHLNKSENTEAINRINGSGAFVAAVRSAWMITKDINDPARRLMLPIKNNLAGDQAGLAYRLISESEGEVPTIKWESGSVQVDINAILKSSAEKAHPERAAAEEFLFDYLQEGPQPAAEIRTVALEQGITWPTLKRAKVAAEIKSVKLGDSWLWALDSRKECSEVNNL